MHGAQRRVEFAMRSEGLRQPTERLRTEEKASSNYDDRSFSLDSHAAASAARFKQR
jgi:hypothetical protein